MAYTANAPLKKLYSICCNQFWLVSQAFYIAIVLITSTSKANAFWANIWESNKVIQVHPTEIPYKAVTKINPFIHSRQLTRTGLTLELRPSSGDNTDLIAIGRGAPLRIHIPGHAKFYHSRARNWSAIRAENIGKTLIFHQLTKKYIWIDEKSYRFSLQETGPFLIFNDILFDAQNDNEIKQVKLPLNTSIFNSCYIDGAVIIAIYSTNQIFAYSRSRGIKRLQIPSPPSNICNFVKAFDDRSNTFLFKSWTQEKAFNVFYVDTSVISKFLFSELKMGFWVSDSYWESNSTSFYLSSLSGGWLVSGKDVLTWLLADQKTSLINSPNIEKDNFPVGLLRNFFSKDYEILNKTLKDFLGQIKYSEDQKQIDYSLKNKPDQVYKISALLYPYLHDLHQNGFALIALSGNYSDRNSYLLIDTVSGKAYEISDTVIHIEFVPDMELLYIRYVGSEEWVSLQTLRSYTEPSQSDTQSTITRLRTQDENLVNSCALDVSDEHLDPDLIALTQLRKQHTFNKRELDVVIRIISESPPEEVKLQLLAQTVQSMMISSSSVANYAFRGTKLFEQLVQISDIQPNPCFTEDDWHEMKSVLEREYLGTKASVISFLQIQPLIALTPFIRKFGFDTKETYDQLVIKLNNIASEYPIISLIFSSARLYLIENIVAPIFGQKQKIVSDITVLKSESSLALIVYSTQPDKNHLMTRNGLGFYHQLIQVIPTKEIKNATIPNIKWQVGPKTFSAKIEIKAKGDLRLVSLKSNGPLKSEIRKDGVVSGVVLVGQNLTSESAAISTWNFKNFYSRHGFQFETSIINNGRQFFYDKLTGEGIDYLVKDAHSFGDEWLWFMTARHLEVAIGTKIAPDGTIHKVYIVNSEYDNGFNKSENFLTAELTSIMTQRNQRGFGPLYYINASCGSNRIAINEITAAASKDFVVIPSLSSTSGFENQDAHILANTLRGIHEGWSWQTIRTFSPKDSRFMNKENTYLFPDMPEFDKEVRSKLKNAYDVDITVLDETTGKQIRIGDMLKD